MGIVVDVEALEVVDYAVAGRGGVVEEVAQEDDGVSGGGEGAVQGGESRGVDAVAGGFRSLEVAEERVEEGVEELGEEGAGGDIGAVGVELMAGVCEDGEV